MAAAEHRDHWGGARLDADAYLRRIGLDAPPERTAEGLARLQLAHASAIPFENLEIVLGRPVLLDLDALQAKLVRSPRGGYCYEQNLLFAAALERFGFDVGGLGGRIRMGSGQLRAVTHALLRVRLDGADLAVDVGVGAHGPLAPIPLREGATASRGGRTWRVTRTPGTEPVPAPGEWVLFGPVPADGGVIDLYSFEESPKHPVDFAVYNHYISTHPRSPFIGRTVVQRSGEGRRLVLIGDELAEDLADGSHTVRRIAPEETPELLAAEFGVELDGPDAAALVKFQQANAR